MHHHIPNVSNDLPLRPPSFALPDYLNLHLPGHHRCQRLLQPVVQERQGQLSDDVHQHPRIRISDDGEKGEVREGCVPGSDYHIASSVAVSRNAMF